MKKLLSIITAGALILSVISGCAQKPAERTETSDSTADATDLGEAQREPVTLEFWHMLTGGDGKYLEEIIEKFNNENQNGIKVNTSLLKADEFSQKLAAATSANVGLPHVAYIEEGDIPVYADSVLIPIDDLMAQTGISKDEYLEDLMNVNIFNGKTYGLPVQTFTWVLYYNKDLLEQLSYNESDIENISLDKIIEMSEKTMALGSDYYGISLSGADAAVFSRLFYTALYQGGSNLFDPADPKTPIFNNEAGISAVEKVIQLGKYTVPNGTGGRPVFVAGNALFHFNGVWEISQLDTPEIKEKLNWGVTEFPNFFGGEYGVWAGVHNVTLTKASETANEKLASMEFCKFITENALILSQAGHIPAQKDLLQSDEFSQTLFSFFQNKFDVFSIPPQGSSRVAIYSQGIPAFTNLYWGDKTDVKAVMDEAAAFSKEIIENE